jgi:PAS domain S-box-containing protein
VNPAFYKILGFTSGSATGRLATEFYRVSEAPFLEQYAAVASGAPPLEMEVEFDPLGKFFKVSAYSHRHQSFVTVFEDITVRKQTEATLKDITHRLELAQELGRSGWWEYDVVNDRATWPDVSHALFGHDPADTTFDNKRFRQLIPAEYHDYYDSQLKKLLDEGMAEFLYPITRPDGQTCWIWSRGEAEYDASGSPVRLFGIMQDITDRKRLEEDHRRNTQRLLAIFNTVPVGIILVKDRIVLEANPRITQLLGYEPREILGRETRRFYVDDEEWSRIGNELETGLAASDLVSLDARVRHKDGRLKYVLMTCSRLYDETPPTILAALQDITQRKEMEDALKASEGRFREIIDASPMPLSLSNDHGKILYINPAFVNTLGYTLEDIPTIDDFWPKGYPEPAYREEVIQKWWQRVVQCEQSQTPFVPMEVRICCKDGSTRTMLATCTLLSGFAEKTRLVTSLQ